MAKATITKAVRMVSKDGEGCKAVTLRMGCQLYDDDDNVEKPLCGHLARLGYIQCPTCHLKALCPSI